MTVVYDKYYQTQNLFGNPYPALISFFKESPKNKKVLDLGCGQGRDSIALARLGFKVTGVDYSSVGIEQMNKIAQAENLQLNGIVADIFAINDFEDYGYILLNSMFHFAKKERQQETQLIHKIAKTITSNAIICFCVQDTGKKVGILKETVKNSNVAFETINDTTLMYQYEDTETGHKSETKYCMYIVKKK